MSARVAVMDQGRLLQLGTPSDIYERPISRCVADFIGYTNLLNGAISSLDDDTISVKTSSGITLVVARQIAYEQRTIFALGQAVTFALRPEKIFVRPTPQPGLTSLEGTVVDSVVGTLQSPKFWRIKGFSLRMVLRYKEYWKLFSRYLGSIHQKIIFFSRKATHPTYFATVHGVYAQVSVRHGK
ncbi:MAG: hypothetical protein AAF702_23610 [Chloroflexota bacterium]